MERSTLKTFFYLVELVNNLIVNLNAKTALATSGGGFFNKVMGFTLMTIDGKPITFGKILLSIVFIAAGIYLSRIVIKIISNKVLSRVVETESALHAIENISFYIMVAFFALMGLQVANIPMTVFTLVGGALALGASLGAQNIFNNLMSGVFLLVERPVKIGDFVQVGDVYGRVEDIGMRATKINSLNNIHLIVPNSKLMQNNVENLTHNSRRVRSEIKVGVRYGSDVNLTKKLLIEAAVENVATLKSREPTVLFEMFGDSSLEFTLLFDIKLNNLIDRRMINSAVRENIDKKFRANDVIIAFPQRDVHVHLPDDFSKKLKKTS